MKKWDERESVIRWLEHEAAMCIATLDLNAAIITVKAAHHRATWFRKAAELIRRGEN